MIFRRHPCGIIYSQAFADYLEEAQQNGTEQQQADELLSLDYVRCASGPHAGESWYQLSWTPSIAIPLEDRYKIGATTVHIHKQTRNGLKHHALHWEDGRVRVLR